MKPTLTSSVAPCFALVMLTCGGGLGVGAGYTDAGYPQASGEPPPRPGGGDRTGETYTFAIDQIFLGDTNRMGTAGADAWRSYGYNIDGRETTASSTDVCTLFAGAEQRAQVDGQNGIDNAWGTMVLPRVEALYGLALPSAVETTYVRQGSWTLQIQIVGLSDDPAQDAPNLTAQVFGSGPYAGAPAFDSSTDWPVLASSLNDGATFASGAVVSFANAYVKGGTFVSTPATEAIIVPLGFRGGDELQLAIHSATVTFDHTSHSEASNGTISGVLFTDEFVSSMQAIAAQSSIYACGSGFNGTRQQIDDAQDILQNSGNMAGTPCNAISIGLGFTAKLVKNPTTVSPRPPPPQNPCAN